MLGKLFRLEMKASARTIVPLYIGMFVIALFSGIRMRISIQHALQQSGGVDPYFNVMTHSTGIAELVLVALTVAVMVMTVIIIIQRFHRNLLEQEGYLMLTLPVTHSQLIISKALGAFCWVICSIVAIGVSWLALVLPVVALEEIVNELQYLWNYWIANRMTGSVVLLIVENVLNAIIRILGLILSAYLAMMIGQMESFHKYHMAVSIIAFVAIHWIMGMIYSPFSGILMQSMMTQMSMAGIMQTATVFQIVTGLINIAVFFFGTRWLMQNQLNI